MDKISIGHGRHCLTAVLDLEARAVMFVGEGKGAHSLELFRRRLKTSRVPMGGAIILSLSYLTAASTHVPDSSIVFEHFHVIKLFNEELTELRRDLHRAFGLDLLPKKVLKSTRQLLLKNPENLDDDRNERSQLEVALSLIKPLATAYYLKEDLRLLWSLSDNASAEIYLDH